MNNAIARKFALRIAATHMPKRGLSARTKVVPQTARLGPRCVTLATVTDSVTPRYTQVASKTCTSLDMYDDGHMMVVISGDEP